MMRAFALERQHRIDHVLDDARSGDLAVFGDMTDKDDGGTGALGEADQHLRGAAHLRHRTRCGLDRVRPHGLDGIDDDEARQLAFGQRRDDVLDGCFSRKLYWRVGKAEPFGAKPYLCNRFPRRKCKPNDGPRSPAPPSPE